MSSEPVVEVKRSCKQCTCGSHALIEMTSLQRKRCADCKKLMYWPLDEGQEPLHRSHRAGRLRQAVGLSFTTAT
jgi:hypothetical protein